MVAEDFLQDAQVRQWLDGIEPAWTLLTLDSLQALRQEPSAEHRAIRIAQDLNDAEIASSAVAHNTVSLACMVAPAANDRTRPPLTKRSNNPGTMSATPGRDIEWNNPYSNG